MKQFTFNQLQLRILVTLFLFFTISILGYRYFIERPKIEDSLAKLAQRELATLLFSAKKMVDALDLKTRDYAVWTTTHNYLQERNQSYTHENLTDDTFKNMEIDGFYIFDDQLKTVAGRGYSYRNEHELDFEFDDFNKFPNNKHLFPKPTTRRGAPIKNGLLQTKFGVAVFSTVQVRNSELRGDHFGFITFVRLIDQKLFEELSRYTMTNITFSAITDGLVPQGAMKLTENIEITRVRQYSYVYATDINDVPILLVTVKHSNGKMPPLVDWVSFMFIIMLMIVVVIVYYIISATIIRPVTSLADDIKAIGKSGKVRHLQDHYQISELTNISDNFNQLVDVVVSQTQLLAEQAYLDPLTKIRNRRGFENHLDNNIQLCMRKKISFTIIMADIDFFKQFNDELGHIAGDSALFNVAQALNKHFKRKNDLCARYGGEEFIMFFMDINEEDLISKLEDIRLSVEQLHIAHSKSEVSKFLTISLGACIVMPEQLNNFTIKPKNIIRTADTALYQAKENSRNNAVIVQYQEK